MKQWLDGAKSRSELSRLKELQLGGYNVERWSVCLSYASRPPDRRTEAFIAETKRFVASQARLVAEVNRPLISDRERGGREVGVERT